VDLGVVDVKSYSRRRHNDKALSAPFLCAEFIVTVKISCYKNNHCVTLLLGYNDCNVVTYRWLYVLCSLWKLSFRLW